MKIYEKCPLCKCCDKSNVYVQFHVRSVLSLSLVFWLDSNQTSDMFIGWWLLKWSQITSVTDKRNTHVCI